MRVLGFTRYDTKNLGVAAVRMLLPFRELGKRPDFQCTVLGEQDVRRVLADKRGYEWLGYDLYVLQRLVGPGQGRSEFFDALHESGKVIFETDDDLTDKHRDLGYGEQVAGTIAMCDAVTVSTPDLAASVKEFGKPVHVLYNHLDTEWFAQVSLSAERVHDKLVVGLVGTRSHWGDWLLVLEDLKRIQADYPDVVVAWAGYNPPYLEDSFDMALFASVDYKIYPALVRQFDIVLCPLDVEDGFNLTKSSVGALEAMAAARDVGGKLGGAVPVCTDIIVYRRTVMNRHNGLLVKDNQWYTAIAELVENKHLRQKLAVNGLKWVQRHRDIRRGAYKWAKAYAEVLKC